MFLSSCLFPLIHFNRITDKRNLLLKRLKKNNIKINKSLFIIATTHSKDPKENYNSRFYELAQVGDSVLRLLVCSFGFDKFKTKGEISNLLKNNVSNENNSLMFGKILEKLKFEDHNLLKTYNNGKISDKMRETCYEALIRCIYKSNNNDILICNQFIKLFNKNIF